jgi:hypothetical protein
MTATANDAGRIVASGLTKTFGAVRAVSDLSFTVEPGSVTGFQRSGQDDHAADDPGPGDIDVGRGDGERAPIRRSARSRQDRGCGPRGHQLPPGPHRLWSFNSPIAPRHHCLMSIAPGRRARDALVLILPRDPRLEAGLFLAFASRLPAIRKRLSSTPGALQLPSRGESATDACQHSSDRASGPSSEPPRQPKLSAGYAPGN